MFQFVASIAFLATSWACSDFFMNFTDPNLTLSVRSSDITAFSNWTITTWPQSSTFRSDVINWEDAVYDTIGMTVNWSGDEDYGTPSNFLDSMNEMGLSCSVLALADSHYEERSDDPSKINVFNGVFCLYISQMYGSALIVAMIASTAVRILHIFLHAVHRVKPVCQSHIFHSKIDIFSKHLGAIIC